MSVEELVDAVSEQDVPTGEKVTVPAAHDRYLPHRIVAVLIFKPSGKLLVQVHAHHGRRLDHSVGGHVSAGETYAQAAQREMQEELNLDVSLTKIAESVMSREYYSKSGDKNIHIFGVFIGQVEEDWQLKQTEEVDEIREMTVEEIVEAMNARPDDFLQGFMTSLATYLKSINSRLKINAYDKNWGEL
ncbi:MAG: NUDIX hydrolase [bacterium]|nr:NUDIX hydrolase [bacterium]